MRDMAKERCALLSARLTTRSPVLLHSCHDPDITGAAHTHLTGWVTDKPGRPFGKVGGRLILRLVIWPSAMRTGASNSDLRA